MAHISIAEFIYFFISVKGANEYIYNGERTKEELIHFANRLSGPPVQQVTRLDSFDILKSNNPIFFTYVGKQDGGLWETFYLASEHYQPHAYFYATSLDIAKKHFEIDATPAIMVYKERNHYFYPCEHKGNVFSKYILENLKFLILDAENFELVDPSHLNETMYQWINEERFLTFPKITRSNIHHLVQVRKYLVFAVVEENKLNEIAAHEQEFRDMIEIFVHKNRHKYHTDFQVNTLSITSITT
jgi:thioredoxin domain-containing protein 10